MKANDVLTFKKLDRVIIAYRCDQRGHLYLGVSNDKQLNRQQEVLWQWVDLFLTFFVVAL